VSTKSASESVARHIQAMIFSGELTPGTRLPALSDLAARLGVAVVTLRIGLKSLETSGYIVTTLGAHGGSRVSDEAGLARCWDTWLAENRSEIEEMFELRATIEMRVAALAAERRTAADLEDLERANQLLVGPNPSLAPWNVAFHGALARAAHSRYLAAAMEDIQGRLFLPVDLAKYEHQVAELREAHEAVLDAVRAGEPEAAAERMRCHLAETLEVFRRAIDRLPSVPYGSVAERASVR
jgi:DNA-binding FadR family transcriptional regulator